MTNPVPGREIALGYDPEQQWVTFDLTRPGIIAFTAEKNETSSIRELAVEVGYPGIEETPSFTIRQHADGQTVTSTISMSPGDILQRAFRINISPSDKSMSYVAFAKTAEQMAAFPDDEALLDSDSEYFTWSAEANEMTLHEYIATEAISGDTTLIWNCEPGTDYVVYAYGIDLETLLVQTSVAKIDITTEKLYDVEFGISVSVDGHRARVDVTPAESDRRYCAMVFPASDIDPGAKFSKWCSDAWNTKVQDWQLYDNLTETQILERYCKTGAAAWDFELRADTDYRAAVFAVDDKAWLCSEPVTEDFRTGATGASDNVIAIHVSDVASRSASVAFAPTDASQPYAYLVTASAPFEGMSDEEIIEYCATRLYPTVRTGGYSDTYAKLKPGTKYCALAYGTFNGDITTGLFKEEFTTTDRTGTVAFELQFGPYYDLMELDEADPNTDWAYSAQYYDCLLPVEVGEELNGRKYYYALYTTDVLAGLSDEELYDTLYDNGTDYSPTYFLADYDLEFVLAGFAVDDNGDWGPLWKSEPFTMTANGVSDPSGYVNGR